MDTALRTALVHHFGELTMETICSVSRAKELEAENAELRKMVTEERLQVKQLREGNDRLNDKVAELSAKVLELGDAKRRVRTRKPAVTK